MAITEHKLMPRNCCLSVITVCSPPKKFISIEQYQSSSVLVNFLIGIMKWYQHKKKVHCATSESIQTQNMETNDYLPVDLHACMP